MRDPYMQIRWSRDGSMGVKVPKVFTEKTCVFEVNLPPGPGFNVASFVDIAFGSNEIVAPCVHEEPHLGGFTKIGLASVVDLFVYGKDYEPAEQSELEGNLTATS